MRTIAIFAVLLAVACGGEPDLQTGPVVPNVVGDTARAELRVGQTLELDSITLRFLGVDEDSRCPVDVTCVWEGNARIRLAASGAASGDATLTLNTAGAVQPNEASYGGWTISISDVSPAPHSERRIEPSEYRVSLVLAKG